MKSRFVDAEQLLFLTVEFFEKKVEFFEKAILFSLHKNRPYYKPEHEPSSSDGSNFSSLPSSSDPSNTSLPSLLIFQPHVPLDALILLVMRYDTHNCLLVATFIPCFSFQDHGLENRDASLRGAVKSIGESIACLIYHLHIIWDRPNRTSQNV